MTLVGVGYSTHLNMEEAVLAASSMAMERSGAPRVDLVLCFASTEFASHYSNLFQLLKARTGTSRIVGCSAMAVITGDGEFEGSPGLAILAITSDELELIPVLAEESSTAVAKIAEAVRGGSQQWSAENSLLLLLTDILGVRAAPLLEELHDELGYIATVGAAASAHPEDETTFQWALDREANHGLAALLLSGPISHTTRVSQGCEFIGDPYIITKAEGKVIEEIGNRPAYLMLQEALSTFPPEEIERVSKGVLAGILFDEHKYPPGRGDYMIRSIESIDPPSGTVTIVDEIHAGQTIQFQVRNPRTAKEELQAGVREIGWAALPDTPLFALYFESLARGARLHKEPDHDISIIKQGLGDIPIIGFLSNAEFAPREGRNLVHTHSAALTVVCRKSRG